MYIYNYLNVYIRIYLYTHIYMYTCTNLCFTLHTIRGFSPHFLMPGLRSLFHFFCKWIHCRPSWRLCGRRRLFLCERIPTERIKKSLLIVFHIIDLAASWRCHSIQLRACFWELLPCMCIIGFGFFGGVLLFWRE